MQVGAIAGPAIGGYAYAWTPSAAYFLSAALFGIALACMFLVTRVPRNIAVSSAHPLRQIADGLAYVGQNKLVLGRSEEHTSELQSLMRISYAVFCLKKKNKTR